MLSNLGKNVNKRHFEILSYFSQKTEIVSLGVKSCFLWKNKKNIINLFAEFVQKLAC